MSGVVQFVTDGVEITPKTDETLLEAAMRSGVPLIHACGGHARCSTCRVLVTLGIESLDARNERESAMAARLGLPDNIRLSCQIRPTDSMSVKRLVLDQEDYAWVADEVRTAPPNPDGESSGDAFLFAGAPVPADSHAVEGGGRAPAEVGEERHAAILFADIRGFTSFAEPLPPYDVIYVLKRFYGVMSRAVAPCEGRILVYMGDGLMALFLDDPAFPEDAALRAVRAAIAMRDGVIRLNAHLEALYGYTLKIGIGIHYGELVLGVVGHPGERHVTAIGDAVNFASRVESATKRSGTDLLISGAVRVRCSDRIQTGRSWPFELPGKTGVHELFEVHGLKEVE